MTGGLSWIAGPSPWCACCCEYVVRSPADYFCPSRLDEIPPPMPVPRMPLDPISTTAGEA